MRLCVPLLSSLLAHCLLAGASRLQGIALLGPDALVVPKGERQPYAGSAGLGLVPWRLEVSQDPSGGPDIGLLELYNVSLAVDNRIVGAELAVARPGEAPRPVFELGPQLEGLYNVRDPALLQALGAGQVVLCLRSWAFPSFPGELRGRLLSERMAPAYLAPIARAHAGQAGAGGMAVVRLPEAGAAAGDLKFPVFSGHLWGIDAAVSSWRLRRAGSNEVLCQAPGEASGAPHIWDAPCPLPPKALAALRKGGVYVEAVTAQSTLTGTAFPIELLLRPAEVPHVNASSKRRDARDVASLLAWRPPLALHRAAPAAGGRESGLQPVQRWGGGDPSHPWLLPPHVYIGQGSSADVVPPRHEPFAILRVLLLRGRRVGSTKAARSHHFVSIASEHLDPASLFKVCFYQGLVGQPETEARLLAKLPAAATFRHFHLGPLDADAHDALVSSGTFIQAWAWDASKEQEAGKPAPAPVVRAQVLAPGVEPEIYSGAAPAAFAAAAALTVLLGCAVLQAAAWL